MELDLQPGDVVKVLESAALGWVRARVIRVKSGGRVVERAVEDLNPRHQVLETCVLPTELTAHFRCPWTKVVTMVFGLN